jgi:hypothetical protein
MLEPARTASFSARDEQFVPVRIERSETFGRVAHGRRLMRIRISLPFSPLNSLLNFRPR